MFYQRIRGGRLTNHDNLSKNAVSSKNWQATRLEKGTRFYTLRLQQDLFGDWIIVKINGRINSSLGRVRTEVQTSYDSALLQLQQLIDYRVRRRHYQLVR